MSGARVVEFVTIKRNEPLAGRSYGHWWVEIDGKESYGWWPAHPLRLRDVLWGTAGTLNGQGTALGGTPCRDPHHGQHADYEFHPVLLIHAATDEDIRDGIRRLQAGEMIVVPKGTEHRPFADAECHIMLMDREGEPNTGGSPSERTRERLEEI